MAEPHYMLFYDYVPDIVERRGAYRDDHLALIAGWKRKGALLMAGALGDPPHGAAFVFRVDDPGEIERFAEDDPYVAAGLVAARRVERLAVV